MIVYNIIFVSLPQLGCSAVSLLYGHAPSYKNR